MRMSWVRWVGLAALVIGSAGLVACAGPGGPGGSIGSAASPVAGSGAPPVAGAMPPAQTVALFSTSQKVPSPDGWTAWQFHRTKRATRYQLVSLDQERVVEALADGSVSGLKFRLDADPWSRPIFEWRWRVDATLDGADVGERSADDSPVRLVLAFAGDINTLPIEEQMFFERVKLLAGHDMPYATLMYVWDNRRAAESLVVNPHTTRIRKIVVESGAQGVRQWRSYRRDIVADFERVYGAAPGRLIGVAVVTDSDNTSQKIRAWYGDIRMLERNP
jgi:hypothetical protein